MSACIYYPHPNPVYELESRTKWSASEFLTKRGLIVAWNVWKVWQKLHVLKLWSFKFVATSLLLRTLQFWEAISEWFDTRSCSSSHACLEPACQILMSCLIVHSLMQDNFLSYQSYWHSLKKLACSDPLDWDFWVICENEGQLQEDFSGNSSIFVHFAPDCRKVIHGNRQVIGNLWESMQVCA